MSLGGGGGGGSQPSTTTTVQKSDPWEGQQQYLAQGFGSILRAAGGQNDPTRPYSDPIIIKDINLSGSPAFSPAYYGGQTIAGFSPETEAAYGIQAARGLYGSPQLEAAKQVATDTASGAYLGANPYMDSVMQSVQKSVIPATASQFSSRGRYGSGAMANATASALSEQAGKMAYQNYADERARQMQAAALAPTLQAADYQNAAALSEVGAAREKMQQALLDEAQKKYYYEATQPLNAIQNYMSLVQGNYGSSGTTTQYGSTPSVRRNALGSALGGASALGGLGAALGASGPVGWGLAGVGGLLGLMGG